MRADHPLMATSSSYTLNLVTNVTVADEHKNCPDYEYKSSGSVALSNWAL